MLTAPALTLVFLGVVVGLGTAFVWMFWEIEQSTSKPRRNGDGAGSGPRIVRGKYRAIPGDRFRGPSFAIFR